MFRCFVIAIVALWPCAANDANWLMPQSPDGTLNWGRKDGVVFGLQSPGGMPGPRGLIRIGLWNRSTNQAELINFIAVEPVVVGAGSRQSRMAFSELERGGDGRQGKRFTVPDGSVKLETLSKDPLVDRLSVRIDVEPFTKNGTHVYVIASMRSDQPGEVMMTVHHFDDSAPIEELTLTATMGNYERLRWLWLKGKVIDSRVLYEGHTSTAFIDKENYGRDEILTLDCGDAIALATTNEADPSQIAIPQRPFWTYKSRKVTQYWKVPKHQIQPNLRVKVNGRYTYWQSSLPIPGGVAFENFEMRQSYVPGQMFIFGLTETEPRQIQPAIEHLASPPE